MTKKYRLFKVCKDFSIIQLSNYRGLNLRANYFDYDNNDNRHRKVYIHNLFELIMVGDAIDVHTKGDHEMAADYWVTLANDLEITDMFYEHYVYFAYYNLDGDGYKIKFAHGQLHPLIYKMYGQVTNLKIRRGYYDTSLAAEYVVYKDAPKNIEFVDE